MSLSSFLVLLLSPFLVELASAAPTLIPITQTTGPVRANGYIVQYKERVVDSEDKPHLQILGEFGPEDASLRHEYINGVAGTFSHAALKAFQQSPEVESIELDTIGGVDELVTQTDAPWGLQRISQIGALAGGAINGLNYNYTYDDSAGEGADVYVVDTGINIAHEEFEGRARWGVTFGGYTPDQDGYGHGTHVAGIAGGKTYGVAKKVDLIAVRVLSNSGSGAVSDCIAGVQWAMQQAQESERPSVITISLKFPPSDVLDSAVTDAVKAGVHVTVSAGNAGTLSSSQSPARAVAAVAVGASDITDSMAAFSNFGPDVDIYAPGSGIISSYIPATNSTRSMSGTSMAAPHIAGLFAYLIAKEGDRPTEEVLSMIREYAPKNLLKGIPAGTINELADNGAPYEDGYAPDEHPTLPEGASPTITTIRETGTLSPEPRPIITGPITIN